MILVSINSILLKTYSTIQNYLLIDYRSKLYIYHTFFSDCKCQIAFGIKRKMA